MSSTTIQLTDEDRAALHERYRIERDKRLRPEGAEQYVEPTGKFAHLTRDPYTPRVEREPIAREVELLFLGCGFAGLTICAGIKESGIDDFLMLDAAGDFGGVWYWNRYPGAMCDTAAMVYLPLLEETGHMPSAKYVKAPEIWGHAKRIAEHYDLYPHAVFSTHVTGMTWDETDSRWIVTTDRGDEIRARFVASGTGPLNRPKLPGIPGLETFAGQSFHTSRWEYDVTGGSYEGQPMTALADKRVGLIGTGATAVQIVPPLGRDAGELFVFQRTPSAVDFRGNHPIDPDWFGTLQTGWQEQWLRNFADLATTGRADVDLVKDGWTDITKRIVQEMLAGAADPTKLGREDFIAAYHRSDDIKTTEIRRRTDAVVEDQATADMLKAWYRQYCKRPCFHDEYLPTFNRPNVHLVDTDGQGVERIDETGVWVNGEHYELDVLIYASGFEVNSDYSRKASIEITGRDGVTLTEKWADGMRSLHGMHVHGFPNLFIIGLTQGSAFAANVTSNYPHQAKTLAAILAEAQRTGATQVEPTPQAENEWVALIESAPDRIIGGPDCTPGYYNNEGRPEGLREKRNSTGYPLGPVPFFDYMAKWRSSGEFTGLEFRQG